MLKNLRLFLCVTAVMCLPVAAHAGFIVTIASADIDPGGSSTIDVFLRADPDAQLLNRFNFEFRITPLGSTATQLRFLNPQDDLQLLDPRYVFSEGSFRRDGAPPFIAPSDVGMVSTSSTGFPDDTFIGGDFAEDGSPFTVDAVSVGTIDELLVSLQVVSAPGTLSPASGDAFQIDLITGPNTFFRDGASAEIDFVSTSGTVTVTDASATVIPEPASLTLLGLGLAGLAACRLRRRQRAG